MLLSKGKIIFRQGYTGFYDQPWDRQEEARKLKILADDVTAGEEGEEEPADDLPRCEPRDLRFPLFSGFSYL